MIFNLVISIGVVLLQIASLVLLFGLSKKNSSLKNSIKKNANLIGLFVTGAAVLTSLVYSTIFGFEPCLLCWWARIFMFPQFILFAVAYTKDKNISLESFLLSFVGVLITGYHSYIDFAGGGTLVSCGAEDLCLKRYVFELGYITIPVMAFSGFVFLLLLSIYNLKKK